ncbi:MAG: metal-dependent hydrolase [Bdellovibrionales bacterium]|nr:metal-dependent hydrolase [Bdellovibrionales bacterium]
MKTMRPPAAFEIRPRRQNFNFDERIPRHWNDNDPIKTHFLNALSVILPAYEQFFIKALLKSKNLVRDLELKKEVQGFCGQEGTHATEHRKYNLMLGRQGYTAVPFFEKSTHKVLSFLQEKVPVTILLAMTAAGEHLTTFMGHDFLADPEKWSKNSDPTMNALWEWHAAEELEHKNVCYDVYQHVSGGWLKRILTMILANTVSLGWVSVIYFYLLWKDGVLLHLDTWRNYYRLMLGGRGFLKHLLLESLNYAAREFHPSKADDRQLIQSWRNRSEPATAPSSVL